MDKAPKSDLSPEFIQEMKSKLEQEQAELAARLKKHAHKDHGDYKANVPDYGRDDEANAMEMADYTADVEITEKEEARLKEINAALERIQQGTYGFTADGTPIPEDRLRANPAATTIVQ